MSNYAISLKRTSTLLAALAFTALLLVVNFASFFSTAKADQLINRSLTLSSTLDGPGDGVAGSPTNGDAAVHTFAFTASAASATVEFEYCTDAVGTCTAPVGLDLQNATVGSLSNATGIISDAANVLTLSGGVTGAGATSVEVTGIVNPTYIASPSNPDDNTFFVRITTLDGSSATVDDGTVASAITQGVVITARVAETLGFSTTGVIDTTNVPDPTTSCEPLAGTGAITLGDPTENTLALGTTYDNYSAFRIYTNAAGGAVVTYEGETLERDGSNNIDAVGAPTGAISSVPGTEQFGLGIDTTNGGAGTAAPVTVASRTAQLDLQFVDDLTSLDGGNPGGLAINTNYDDGAGTITNGGDATFGFEANTPTAIANSTATGYIDCKTVAVRYIANIAPLTAAGTYTTTVVYSAVPTY